jgi:tape measure domain-containing protein
MTATVVVDIVGRDNFSGVLGNFGNVLTGLKSAIDLVGDGFRAFSGFALQGLDAIAGYERMEASLQSLTASQILQAGAAEDMAAAMAIAAPKAEELLGWIQELAIKSPFTSEGVAQAFRMAQAYGFSAEEAKRLTQALIDFAAGSGASEYAMQQIARALGQISATGKLTGGDMLQLVNAGLPVAQILADAFGVSTAKIMEMREKGLIPAKDAIEAITVYLETNFKGAAENQANTWAGLQGTFADLKTMGLREFFGGIFDAIQPMAVAFAEWMQGPGMDRLATLGNFLGDATTVVVELATGISMISSGNLEGVGDKLYNIGAALYQMPNEDMWDLGDAIMHAGISMNNGMPAFEAFKGILEDLSDGNGPLTEFSNLILETIDSFEDDGFGAAVDTFAGSLIDGFTDKINTWVLMGGPEKFSDAIIDAIRDFGTEGSDGESKIVTAMERLVGIIGDIIKRIDWSEINDAINKKLTGFATTMDHELATAVNRIDWDEFGSSVSSAVGRAVETAFTNDQEDSSVSDKWLVLKLMPGVAAAIDFFTGTEFGRSIIDGILRGLGSIPVPTKFLADLIFRFIVNPIKDALGIASPSTVFEGVGKDIIQGLINGFTGMITTLSTIIGSIVDAILGPFAPVLSLLGIDATSVGTMGGRSTSTVPGEVGGRVPTGTDGRTDGTATGAVVNNFYGAVYFGDMGQLGYDCPSPHPLMTASSQSLLTSGLE